MDYSISDQMAADSAYIERLFREDLAREQDRTERLGKAALAAMRPITTADLGEFAP